MSRIIIIMKSIKFLSTLSLRRATNINSSVNTADKISIHALLAESDSMRTSLFCGCFDFYPRSPCGERPAGRPVGPPRGYFYPRSPCGERPRIMIVLSGSKNFYPRSPCGERQALCLLGWLRVLISIHALLAESDNAMQIVVVVMHAHFYPRSPCGERLIKIRFLFRLPKFLSTLSLRRATRLPTALRTPHHRFLSTLSLRRATVAPVLAVGRAGYFYPRSPCGERPKREASEPIGTLHFYPRSPCGERRARRASRQQPAGISIHALLAESDVAALLAAGGTRYFYPRSPCGERPGSASGIRSKTAISIHALLAESDKQLRL